MLNQSMASHMHAPCMHACKYMYIHPHRTSTLIQLNRYTQKYIIFWLWPKRPPFFFQVLTLTVKKKRRDSVENVASVKFECRETTPCARLFFQVLPFTDKNDAPVLLCVKCVKTSPKTSSLLDEHFYNMLLC